MNSKGMAAGCAGGREAQEELSLTLGTFVWFFLGEYKLLCRTSKKHMGGLLALGTQ